MPTLALCMIVKNAAATLRPCLESVTGIVDQIVIADTGCTDQTCEIAREFGATILSYPWQDHFANARNAALAGATTDWVLVLDADEELGAEAKHFIVDMLAAPEVGGYMVPITEYVPFDSGSGSVWTYTILPNNSKQERAHGAPSYIINTLCRLFRRREDIYFTGRVHEVVQTQVEAAGLRLEPAPFSIHHFGHLAPHDVTVRKRAFYNNLLQKRLADDPKDATSLTMCGLDEYEVHGRPLEALRYFRRALEQVPNAFETWLLMAKVLCSLQLYEEALAALDMAQHPEKDLYLQYTLRGDALKALGRLEQARAAYQTALGANPEDKLLRAKKDYLDLDLGDRDAAIARLKAAAVETPQGVDIHELFVNACIRDGRLDEAAQEAERFIEFDMREAFLLRPARLRAQLRQWSQAESLARQCVMLYPDSVAALELRMMCLISLGRLPEAAADAELLTSFDSKPRAFLRAAGIYAQLGEGDAMKQCLERGLQCFPQSRELQEALAEMHSLAAAF